ncbi:MAG: 30S ribosomal protein THX [Bacteroidetes bacterium]|nr:30S ribosomal protein THX [Bacteroidota bacterium]
MGRGDQRSKKGKMIAGSYGVNRPRPSAVAKAKAAKALLEVVEKPAKVKKVVANKPAAKKTVKKKEA